MRRKYWWGGVWGAAFTALLFSGCAMPWQTRVQSGIEPTDLAGENKVAMKVTTPEGKVYDYFVAEEEGLTAFDLFARAGVPVEFTQYDFGVYVKAVGGVSEGGGKYWIYYINGKPAMQAADQYRVQSDDLIEWKLEKEKKGM